MTKIRTSSNQKLTVSGGTLIISDTSAHTGLVATSLTVREDTVISVCTGLDIAGNTYDFKTALNWPTLKAGDLLICPDNYQINAITLTSGSILLNQF